MAAIVLFVLIGSLVWMDFAAIRQTKLDHALIQAIKAEDNPKILEVLAQGADGEARDTEKQSAFREILHRLLDRFRPASNVDQQKHSSPLLLLYGGLYEKMRNKVHIGPGPSLTVVRALLDHGAQPNDTDQSGTNPLFYASRFSNVDTVRLLLERGANIEIRNEDSGLTPLIGADASVTKLLLDHGANIEAVNNWKSTALMYAARHVDPAVVRILLEHGAKVGAKDKTGHTAFYYLRSSMQGTPEDRRKVADLLRAYGLK